MVVDTSALLAMLLNEPPAAWVAEQLRANRRNLLMSTVNLAETLIRLRSILAGGAGAVETDLLNGSVRFVAPTVEQARQAAIARGRFPLNLGDCFAYALSVAEDCPILTLDDDFRRCDRPVVMPEAG
jgi:ribonuclease VapC